MLDWQPGNLRGDLAGQVVTKRCQRLAVVDFLIGLFRSIPRKKSSDPLGGGVSPKRVAARYRLAEEFGRGSVSVRESSAKGFKPEDFGANSFLAGIRGWRR